MSNELQTKLDAIKLDKDTNLLPEHLKAGITCLGVEGNIHVPNIPEFELSETVDCDLSQSNIFIDIISEYDFDFSQIIYQLKLQRLNTVTNEFEDFNMGSTSGPYFLSRIGEGNLRGQLETYINLWQSSYYNDTFRIKVLCMYDGGYVEKYVGLNLIIPTEVTVEAQVFDSNGNAIKILERSNFSIMNVNTQEPYDNFELMDQYYTNTIRFKESSGVYQIKVTYDGAEYNIGQVDIDTNLANYNFNIYMNTNLPITVMTTNIHTEAMNPYTGNVEPYYYGCAEIEWLDENDSVVGTDIAYNPYQIQMSKVNAKKASITIKGYDIEDTVVIATNSDYSNPTVNRISTSDEYWYTNVRVTIPQEQNPDWIKNYDKDDVEFTYEFGNGEPSGVIATKYGSNFGIKVPKSYTGSLKVNISIEGYISTYAMFNLNEGSDTNLEWTIIMQKQSNDDSNDLPALPIE